MSFWRCLCLMLILVSCEKSIEIQPASKTPLLVVDAQIENGQAPIVQLSNSLNYFSAITPAIFSNSFVHDALITISDGTITKTLKEYNVPLGGGYSYYFYSTDSQLPVFLGTFEKKYTLSITANNKNYAAQTTIPKLTKTVDSLWWKPSEKNEDTTKVILMAKVTDPKGYGNYIRYFTRVNNGQFLPGANSVFDDQVIDGATYDVQIDQGISRNETIEFNNYGFFKRGDTATVKLCNIDKATFDFWRTIEFGYQSVGNPFASPVKVLGNINNGALGAFSGYAAQYKTLIIPK